MNIFSFISLNDTRSLMISRLRCILPRNYNYCCSNCLILQMKL